MSEHTLRMEMKEEDNGDGTTTTIMYMIVDGKNVSGWQMENDGTDTNPWSINWDDVAGMDLKDILVDLTDLYFGH